jgi:hypothetical protein
MIALMVVFAIPIQTYALIPKEQAEREFRESVRAVMAEIFTYGQASPEIIKTMETATVNYFVYLTPQEQREALASALYLSPINDEEPNPYCDQVTEEYMQNGGVCHDRKDQSETTGLFTCNDFTHVRNWTECKDATIQK